MTVWGLYRRALRTEGDRRKLWRLAYSLWYTIAGSAKYLAGTHRDRQTGAAHAHRWRQQLGQQRRAHSDQSGLRVAGSDGESRLSSFEGEQALRRQLTPVADRVRAGKYRPRTLQEARWPKDPHDLRRGWRVVEMPTVIDRLVCSVLLEVLEPLLDPALSDHQHGYRASRVLGRYQGVPEFPGVPRGSTKIVARRLARQVSEGGPCVWEIDVVNAFPSVSRKRLHAMLVEDGCPRSFANEIIATLGREVVDRSGTTRRTGGIPLGNPVGALLFNFFLRGVHTDVTEGTVTASYADNLYGVARDYDLMVREMSRTVEHLHALGLSARGMGVDLSHRAAWGWRILGTLRLVREPTLGDEVTVKEVKKGRSLGGGEFTLDPRTYRPLGGLRAHVLDVDDRLREEGVVP